MTKNKSIVILTVFTILIILGGVFAFVSLDNGELGIHNYIAYPKNISLGLDLSGGAYAVYEVDKTKTYETADGKGEETWAQMDEYRRKSLLEGTRASLESMLVSKNYTEAQVTVVSDSAESGRIRVEVPNVDDPERIFQLIGKPAELEFKQNINTSTGEGDSFNPKITGKDISNAGVSLENGKYVVALRFNSKGAKKFADATSANVGKSIGIYIDDKLVVAPTVNEAISSGSCSISNGQNGYSYEEANALAVQILAGSFDLSLNIIESNTLTAQLGENAIMAGVIAGLVGLALIVIYICALYRLMGVAASLALVYYTMTYVFFLGIIPWVQLTLSGIAGVLLSIGMAVDANVIIFERIKEEYAAGKTLRTSVSTGFKRSYGAIIDGNVTTIIGAIVLIIVGAASIKGFGITLLIGILLSLISSLLITRLLLSCIMVFNKEKDASKFALKRKYIDDEEDADGQEAESSDLDAAAEGGKA